VKGKVWRIEVATRGGLLDPAGAGVRSDIRDLGITGVTDVRFVRVTFIRTKENRKAVEAIAAELLSDPVSDVFAVEKHVLEAQPGAAVPHRPQIIEVVRKPGVMDPVEASTLKGIRDMGRKASEVHTARRYLLAGSLSHDELVLIAEKLLANPSIETYCLNADSPSERPEAKPYHFKLIRVAIRDMNDESLAELSRRGQLYLSLDEMRAIRDFFARVRRDPTDVELESLAQTWS